MNKKTKIIFMFTIITIYISAPDIVSAKEDSSEILVYQDISKDLETGEITKSNIVNPFYPRVCLKNAF